MNAGREGAALVGDVVGSRRFADQAGLLTTVSGALSQVNARLSADQPLEVTVGDEFQGVYPRLGGALLASLLVRLLLAGAGGDDPDEPAVEARIGIGWGGLEQSPAAEPPFGQSGPAWWHARRALDEVRAAGDRTRWPRTWRTGFVADDRELTAAVRAFLLCRDDLVGAMDARDRRILVGVLAGEHQAEVGAELGITQPAVAKRHRTKGINAVFRAHRSFDAASWGSPPR